MNRKEEQNLYTKQIAGEPLEEQNLYTTQIAGERLEEVVHNRNWRTICSKTDRCVLVLQQQSDKVEEEVEDSRRQQAKGYPTSLRKATGNEETGRPLLKNTICKQLL